MKIWTSEHVFQHPWETVVQASWRKYPNPMNQSVVGIDTTDVVVSEQKGKLNMHRVLSTNWAWPGWVSKLLGFSGNCYVSEHSEVDLTQKTMTLKSKNLTLYNTVSIDEQLTYTQHSKDKDCTVLKSESFVTVRGVPMTSYMEGLIKSTMASKSHQGKQAIEWVIHKFQEEMHDIQISPTEDLDPL